MIPTRTTVTLKTVYYFKNGEKSEHYSGKLFFAHGIDQESLEKALDIIGDSIPYNDGALIAEVKSTYENF